MNIPVISSLFSLLDINNSSWHCAQCFTHILSLVFMLRLMSGNIIVYFAGEETEAQKVKQLAQDLTAQGSSSGSEPEQYDSRAMLLTTGLHDLWGLGFSLLCWLSCRHLGFINKCQLSTFPGNNKARCGSLIVIQQLPDHLLCAQCVPSESGLEPNWLCAWGPCDCGEEKRNIQKSYLLKQQH